MNPRLVAALLIFVVVWSSALCYARMVAAKEKAGEGRPWAMEFLGLGWLRAGTQRGRRHASAAKALLAIGPVIFFMIFFAFARRGK